jgi:hypothetical protein
MTPQYLNELADVADPDQLWRLDCFAQMALPTDKRRQLDTGVALRRAAMHEQRLLDVLAERKSLLLTPLSTCGLASAVVATPAKHVRLRSTDAL